MFRNISFDALNIKTSLLEKLRLTKIGNFEGMDISMEELTEISREVPVSKIKSLFEYFDVKIGGWPLPFLIGEEEEKFKKDFEKLKNYLELAKEISAFRVYTYILPFSDTLSYDENFKFHKERIEKICKELEKYNCVLGIEFIGTESIRKGKKYEFVHTLEQIYELCKSIKMENVGILLDSWHLYASDGDIKEIKNLKGNDIVYVHINDAPDIPKSQLVDNERFLPGETGVIDLVGFLKALKEIGYNGPVTPEPFNKRINLLPNEIAVRLTGGYLLKIWEKVFK